MLSGPFIVGSLIACRATPTDGKDDGTPVEDSATVENTTPTVSSVTLSPSSVYTNDTVTATAVLDDVDGQTVTADYAWHVIDFATGSDTMVQSGSDNTLSGVTHFDRDDEVYVVVTPNDGVDDGSAETSAALTVMNTAPGAPVVSLSPDPAIEGEDDLVCVIDVPSSDDDGDAVVYTYEWTDPNGASAQTTAEVADLSDTFAASGTSVGDWTCDVTAFDGTDVGGSDSATVTVESGCPVEGDGSAVDCPSLDCAKILADGHSTGDGIYWIDPQMDGSAYEVYCLMDSTYDSGGWTLISTHSDDGQDTWTWNNRHYFDTDTTTFGSLSAMNEDFKSMALHDVGMQDLLFVHAPSGVWAGYNDVDTGSGNFGSFIDYTGGPNCYSTSEGYTLSSGTFNQVGNVCDTNLYISPKDHDGDRYGLNCNYGGIHQDTIGPAWSVQRVGGAAGDGCPFDDVGVSSSLGVDSYYTSQEALSIGYGQGMNLNTASAGTAENYMQVFVRRNYTDADGDDVAAWEDCDDGDASISPNEPEICDGIDNNCNGQIDETCNFVWQNMGQRTEGIVTGCCSNTQGFTANCDSSVLGAEIHIASGGNSIERKNLYDTGFGRNAAQGNSISLSNNNQTASWSGGTGCGCDSLQNYTVSVYECVAQ